MAELVALRAALTRMELSQPAAVFVTDSMGLNTLQRWRDFQEDDDLSEFAKSIRNPGGTIPDQNGNPIRHPGFLVGTEAIKNIRVMRLALKHHQYIQRQVAAADIDVAWVTRWTFLIRFRKDAAKKKPTDETLPKIDMKDWAMTKEKIVMYFGDVYGRDGIPLGYIIRDEVDVPAEALDPQDNYGTDYVRELIRRAPHTGETYDADSRTMCILLKKMCIGTPAYQYISRLTADGRAAWDALMTNYLGPQHVGNQATIFEAKITGSRYDGESARFTFDNFVNIHKTAHTRLEGLTDHGYGGMDEGTKIRHFLKGIKTDKLKTVVELVRGNPEFDTFDAVARRIKDTIVAEAPSGKGRRDVSSVTKDHDGKEVFPGVTPDMNVEDKYYKGKEWQALSAAKKKGVLIKRQRRNGGPKKNNPKGKDKRVHALERKVDSLVRSVADLRVAPQQDDDAASDADDGPPTKKQRKANNRDHPDLNRRRR